MASFELPFVGRLTESFKAWPARRLIMEAVDQGQVTRSAAEVYEEFFVPALFREPARPVVRRAEIESGHRVLDVACGTRVLAREAAALAGPGHLTGLDGNEAVLAVAKRLSPDIAWRSGFAEDALMPLCNSRAVVIAEGVFAH